ncbi:imidazolonepropionase [Halorubellus sp. JP-L1]|uniref:imidazolonepropionase n=1 Tax=Halorubellus sp. JP-L1 TaxID=2715753 RepID=UPI001409FB6C|nr:imidazolonepropionase [Halorubellus sp. JP-L1]NHN43023.1 imidazolonepropionase [Halorubellus sp. JP-L1]
MSAGNLQTVVHGAAEVVVGKRDGAWPGGDPADELLEVHEDAAIAVVDGEVAAVGPTEDVLREYPAENADEAYDASGQSVVPGFVDPHTHAVFAGDRSDEFEAKLRGKSYQDILAEGGGILRTVRAVREASENALAANLREHLDAMLAYGTTTVEVKSGYGLDTETELKLLRAVDDAASDHPIDVVPTFMGAHAIPEGEDADEYVDAVVDEQIPAAAEQGVAEFCDVFCEEGVFSVEQSRRVLEAGEEAGLTPKVHAEELAHIGGTKLAAEVGAASADHLLHSTREDVDALVDANVVPVVLPGTAFGLGADYADAETMLDAGAPVAVATDFNPNCHSRSMGFAQSLCCVEMGMTPAQALVAATEHAAMALDRPARGRLDEGSRADMAVVDAPSHVHVPYQFGENTVDAVFKAGDRVV